MEWYLKVLKNFANFNGRARRKEYWMYTFINIVILIALMIICFIAIGIEENVGKFFLILPFLYTLVVFIPTVAVVVRRLHDINQSGLWYLIAFIPLGNFILLVFMMMNGTPGPNQYGPNPKEITGF
ncbi:MAG: DUF805 domain-containing protein [Tannerella sp.]|jgi:uncharacterized membrane protein YhaH (DUF805 family)|nr:DUF805 domain-containing protein [Tannerella sp.]